ncbi:hypothetical protein ACLOJK_039207 [Asimina triloba]
MSTKLSYPAGVPYNGTPSSPAAVPHFPQLQQLPTARQPVDGKTSPRWTAALARSSPSIQHTSRTRSTLEPANPAPRTHPADNNSPIQSPLSFFSNAGKPSTHLHHAHEQNPSCPNQAGSPHFSHFFVRHHGPAGYIFVLHSIQQQTAAPIIRPSHPRPMHHPDGLKPISLSMPSTTSASHPTDPPSIKTFDPSNARSPPLLLRRRRATSGHQHTIQTHHARPPAPPHLHPRSIRQTHLQHGPPSSIEFRSDGQQCQRPVPDPSPPSAFTSQHPLATQIHPAPSSPPLIGHNPR